MKYLTFVLLMTTAALSFAATHTMKPGDTYISQDKGESISCATDSCRVSFKFVTKEYQVWTPKNEVFSSHKTEAGALTSASKLITLKVCEKIDLDYQTDK